MIKLPKISIVMPVFNMEQYLQESIESVLQQTFNEFEFLIIDDGSTDKSLEIIHSYKDSRIQATTSNHNFIDTLNIGITRSKGKYIARMDADDMMINERLQKQYQFMESNPEIDISGTWMQQFADKNEIMTTATEHEDLISLLIMRSSIFHPTVIIKKDKLSDLCNFGGIVTPYKHEYVYAEDYKLWTEMVIAGWRFANIPEVLLKHRISTRQVTQTHVEKIQICKRKIQIEYAQYIKKIILNTSYNNNRINLLNKMEYKLKNNTLGYDEYFKMLYVLFILHLKMNDTLQKNIKQRILQDNIKNKM